MLFTSSRGAACGTSAYPSGLASARSFALVPEQLISHWRAARAPCADPPRLNSSHCYPPCRATMYSKGALAMTSYPQGVIRAQSNGPDLRGGTVVVIEDTAANRMRVPGFSRRSIDCYRSDSQRLFWVQYASEPISRTSSYRGNFAVLPRLGSSPVAFLHSCATPPPAAASSPPPLRVSFSDGSRAAAVLLSAL